MGTDGSRRYSGQAKLILFLFINTLRPTRNRRHFADDIFKCILLNENVLISIKISLKFIPKGPINNIPALVQIMAWRRPGDKPLSEPMMVRLQTHICVTRPQWVKRHDINHTSHNICHCNEVRPAKFPINPSVHSSLCCQGGVIGITHCSAGCIINTTYSQHTSYQGAGFTQKNAEYAE